MPVVSAIRAICFDLDDTLWDTPSVIQRAERTLYEWFEQHYPRVTEQYTEAELHELRLAASKRWPELHHDLTELRVRVLGQIAERSGYDEQMVARAYEVFFAARNDVELFADVLPVLDQLSDTYKLIAMSNGNADLQIIGISSYFEAIYGAREMGVAKPDVRFFAEAARRCGLKPEEMLHVGDHPANDIVAAKQAGMQAVWLNRPASKWPVSAESNLSPDAEIADLHDLVRLLQQ